MEEQSVERDLTAEAAQFKAAHPEVTQLSDQVTAAWAGGMPLTEAWEAQQERADQPMQEEDPIQQQNRETAARAPVAGVTGLGQVQQPRRDDFLSGLELDQW